MIEVGDVVRLKSGGPEMTVYLDLGKGMFYCQWFAGTDVKVEKFAAASLEKVEPATDASG